MKNIAIECMKMMDLLPAVVEDFQETGRVYYSEGPGILYWADNKPEFMEVIKELEKDGTSLVFHCTYAEYEFGACLTMFFVPKDKRGQEYLLRDVKDKQAYVYVHNFSEPMFSEYGMISFLPIHGGIVRVS